MLKLTDGMFLYHGSYCEVECPSLNRCAKYKDFGQGFYLTTSKQQAESFAKISTKKAITNGITDTKQLYGVVSKFKVADISELQIKTYQSADVQWLHCVVGHRKRKSFPDIIRRLEEFDVIAGKIADDNTNTTINAYMSGVFGTLGTKMADDFCISLLLPNRLQDQFCFRTNTALGCLVFVESEKIWM